MAQDQIPCLTGVKLEALVICSPSTTPPNLISKPYCKKFVKIMLLFKKNFKAPLSKMDLEQVAPLAENWPDLRATDWGHGADWGHCIQSWEG